MEKKILAAVLFCCSAFLTFCGSSAPAPQCCIVTGTGGGAALSTMSLNFGNVTPGQVSTAQTVTLTSVGVSALSVTTVSISANFSIQGGTCAATPFTLGSNASCTFSITFSPVATGVVVGSLLITDNASPPTQAVALSGNGVAAATCGSAPPTSYPALRTDTNLTGFPSPIFTLPAAGGTFAETTANGWPTNYTGVTVLRVTDGSTAANDSGGTFTGNSFHGLSGADHQEIACDGSGFMVVMNDSKRYELYSFNESTTTATFKVQTRFVSDPAMSRSQPNITYGYIGTNFSASSTISAYDSVAGTYNTLFDIASQCPGIRALTTSDTTGAFTTSADTTGAGVDTYVAFDAGPGQNKNDLYIIWATDGRGCRWLNTISGQIGGSWGPTCASCAPLGGTGLHDTVMDKSGQFATLVQSGTGGILGVWTFATTTVTSMTQNAGGHRGTGWAEMINLNQPTLLLRQLATPNTVTSIEDSVKDTGDHYWGWSNDSSAQGAPSLMTGNILHTANQVCCTAPAKAGDGEIRAVQTNGGTAGVTWRIGQTLTSSDNNDAAPLGNFWRIAQCPVSPDGHYALCTSDWQQTLPNDNDGVARFDVLLFAF